MSEASLSLRFDRGTLVLEVLARAGAGSHSVERDLLPEQLLAQLPGVSRDPRIGAFRAPAWRYREIVLALRREEIAFEDEAKEFAPLDLVSRLEREPFPHQKEAVEAWVGAGRRGVVVLPTGTGKTFAAQLAIEATQRDTLVVTPTIDLMNQWYGVLATAYDREIGLVGGGYYDVQAITVTTYDSAYLHMERFGGRFGLLVFDECHHLPGPSFALAAECSIAPFRLGLTATPEREDGGERRYEQLIGPIIYRREIKELAGDYLAEYETVRLRVDLSEDEKQRWLEARAIYRGFLDKNNLRLGGPGSWIRFLQLTSRSKEGRRAFLAYREQKTIAEASEGKLQLLERLFERHRQDRILIFTQDNATAYRISRRFLIPALTHQTKAKERHAFLQAFDEGSLPFLVTSKVLNEGVDVPAANVAIVLSGSGTVREHVQRLGRILRRGEGKQAVLYEVVAADTAEEMTSERRRRHDAYR